MGPGGSARRNVAPVAVGTRAAVRAVVARPRLWTTALRQAVRLARPRWWRRAPFLPLPPAEYVRWRMLTAYGDEHAVPPVDDVVRFARWRRETMGV